MKIIQKDVRIPDEVKFSCSNCGTIFSTDKFRIESISRRLKTENRRTGLFSWETYETLQDMYALTHRCPRCAYWCTVEIDKGEPIYENKQVWHEWW